MPKGQRQPEPDAGQHIQPTTAEIRDWTKALGLFGHSSGGTRRRRDVVDGVRAYIVDALVRHGAHPERASRIAGELCGSLPRIVNRALVEQNEALGVEIGRIGTALAAADIGSDPIAEITEIRQQLEWAVERNIVLTRRLREVEAAAEPGSTYGDGPGDPKGTGHSARTLWKERSKAAE